jgi:hypothetical protein
MSMVRQQVGMHAGVSARCSSALLMVLIVIEPRHCATVTQLPQLLPVALNPERGAVANTSMVTGWLAYVDLALRCTRAKPVGHGKRKTGLIWLG